MLHRLQVQSGVEGLLHIVENIESGKMIQGSRGSEDVIDWHCII